MNDPTNKPFIERFGLYGSPNIKIFRNGVEVLHYQGTRNAEGFVENFLAEKEKQVSAQVLRFSAAK